ncbi:MAG: type II toxin-antitoxin system HigA family antitoxin [Bacteroidia bacterium]
MSSTFFIKPIRTESEYKLALKRLEKLFDASPDSNEGNEAEVLSILIEKYEDEYFPITEPDPIEAIKVRMEERGIKQQDLVGVIGGKSRVSEVLNKKKRLTLEMVRTLSSLLNIPVKVLVEPYDLV